jgi:TonB family protein
MQDPRQNEAPPPEQPATQPAQPIRPKLDWRIPAAVAAVVTAASVAVAVYFATRPGQEFAPLAPPPASVEQEAWPGLAEYDRLGVRPLSIPRPTPNAAMLATFLSGYADLEFTVGADGKASDIRVIRESAEDIGYGAEARRLVAAATWPTEWRGRAAPYAGRYRVVFPPGRSFADAVTPISIASPNLNEEILALRRNAAVTLQVSVNADGAVESAQVIDADVDSQAVAAEALRVAMGARYPTNPAGVGYETQLVVRFDVLGALSAREHAPVGPVVALSEVPFAQRPTASDFSRNYPRRALNAGLDGHVSLNCVVGRDLRLDCRIAEEDPPNQGFGNAALRIARRFRAERQFPDGRSTVGAQVSVPMAFRVE